MTITTSILIFAAALVAAILSYAIARAAVSKSLLPDRPNGRSSHKVATPRAGGLAIFGGFAAAMVLLIALQAATGSAPGYGAALCLGMGAFAFGAIDDVYALGARTKFLLQFALALGFVAVFGAVKHAPAPFVGTMDLGFAAVPLTVFWIVAFMNAYNFMDGINGIAGSCAIFALSAMSFVAAAGGNAWAAPAIFLAAALLGYLPLNFIGGRLFMGDGGSQFVGFMIAALAVLVSGGTASAASPLFMAIAFLPFIADVAFTLGHRISRGRNVFTAHNEHVYQLLVRRGGSHQAVATLYLTMVVISTTVAILVNERSAGAQYAAGLLLFAAFAALAATIYRRARLSGLFNYETPVTAPALTPVEQRTQFPAAAE